MSTAFEEAATEAVSKLHSTTNLPDLANICLSLSLRKPIEKVGPTPLVPSCN